jgi:hypothetical protein
MELKKFLDKVKHLKGKNTNTLLTVSILKLEENIVETGDNVLLIHQLGDVLQYAFVSVLEHKLAINNESVPDLDLDNWKNNVQHYRILNPLMNKDVFLYSLRNSLRYILEGDEDTIRIFLFELIIKSFLYIDFLHLSIDAILELRCSELSKKEVIK